MGTLRCKITGCNLDGCGCCQRCGSQTEASHDWGELERERPCFRRERCSRCEVEREQPEHDWETTAHGMRCSRCKLSI